LGFLEPARKPNLTPFSPRLCKVRQAFCRRYCGYSAFVTAGDETIESTLLHPFWVIEGDRLDERPRRDHLAGVPAGTTTPGRWVDAGDLQVRDRLLLRDGRIAAVKDISSRPVEQLVYNMRVGTLECYAVGQNGVLVHNGNGLGGAEGGSVLPTNPDVIAEELSYDQYLLHGDPANWTYQGSQIVPATGQGFEAGTQKVYEVFLDESGQQIEWHYWIGADGSIIGGKVVFPGSTALP
jgi:hypothetical protein